MVIPKADVVVLFLAEGRLRSKGENEGFKIFVHAIVRWR